LKVRIARIQSESSHGRQKEMQQGFNASPLNRYKTTPGSSSSSTSVPSHPSCGYRLTSYYTTIHTKFGNCYPLIYLKGVYVPPTPPYTQKSVINTLSSQRRLLTYYTTTHTKVSNHPPCARRAIGMPGTEALQKPLNSADRKLRKGRGEYKHGRQALRKMCTVPMRKAGLNPNPRHPPSQQSSLLVCRKFIPWVRS
jgi:hypothetical protein